MDAEDPGMPLDPFAGEGGMIDPLDDAHRHLIALTQAARDGLGQLRAALGALTEGERRMVIVFLALEFSRRVEEPAPRGKRYGRAVRAALAAFREEVGR